MAFAIPAAVTYFAATTAVAGSYVAMALYASAALQVVGGITKNEDLQKLGAVVGIGAGIYGAATGAFGAKAIAGEAGADAAIDATVAEAAAESAGSAAADTALEMAQATDYGTVATGNVGAAVNPPANVPGVIEKATAAAGAPPALPGGVQPSSGIINSIKNADPLVKYGALQVGGNALAGAFGPDQEKIAADKLALEKERLAAEQENLEAKRANMNNIGLIRLGIAPNYSASPYPNRTGAYPYRTPVIRNP